MSTLTVQIAILDAAAESLMAMSGTVSAAGVDAAEAVAAMARAVLGSALQAELPTLPVQHAADVLAGRCQGTAARVAGGAQAYRDMEAALTGDFVLAGGSNPVPR